MNDIFREVDEEYRQEQILQFWHSNARAIIIILVLAIAGSAAGGLWQSRRVVTRETESRTLAKALSDAEGQNLAEARATIDQAAGKMSGQRVFPARFAAARAAIDANDKGAAIKLYDDIASDGQATAAERDLATIVSVGLQIQDGDPAQLNARLDKLTSEDSAWRFSAREWQILLAMRQGDNTKAHQIASTLARDKQAPDGIHERAGQLAALTGEGLSPDADMPTAPEGEVTVSPPEAQR